MTHIHTHASFSIKPPYHQDPSILNEDATLLFDKLINLKIPPNRGLTLFADHFTYRMRFVRLQHVISINSKHSRLSFRVPSYCQILYMLLALTCICCVAKERRRQRSLLCSSWRWRARKWRLTPLVT